nr:putative multi-domain non-ribosomal peptide synthetase [uncultured bacterium]
MTANTVEDIYELSPLQQGMLFHSLSAPDDREMYVAQRGYDLHGRLDAEALAKAWRDVVARHPALRTTYHWQGLEKPLQVVHRDATVDLEVLDWRDVPGPEQRERLDRAMADDRAAGFDLAQAPLMRLTLVRLAEERFHFVWTHHMILLDGWSVPLVVREIMLRYAELTAGGVPSGAALRPAPPYRDYIAWLQTQDQAAAERYWRTALAGAPTANALAGGNASAATVAVEEIKLSAADTAALKELAARHRVTLNTVVQACWALVLARHTGGEEAVFGMTTSGRPPALPGVEGMIGLFINTLPLRVTVPRDGTPVGAWLAQTQQRQSAAREYEYSSLPQIRCWSGAPQGRPLFDSIVVFESYPVPAEVRQAVGDLKISTGISVERTSEPLTVVASAEPDLTIRLLHHTDRFHPGLIPAVARQLCTALEHLVGHPDGAVDDIVLVTPDDYARGSAAWNDTRREYPGAATLHGLVTDQVARTPGAVAVWSDGEEETYAGLDARAERRAAALRARGAGPGSIVAVSAERSLDLVVSLLAVLKAGAAYLPLDPRLPAGRMRLMLDDSGAALVLADRDLPVEHPTLLMRDADAPVAGAPPTVSGDDLAYVIYTSGSTGTPKGVPIAHRQIRNRLLWMQETFGLTPDDRVLQKTPYDFDVSLWEFFWPLITGARLVLAAPDGHRDPAYLVRTIAEQEITTVHFVPSMLRHFLDEPGAGASGRLRRVFCSGEALPADLRDRVHRDLPAAGLHNLYGPTEATVDVTWWDCARDAPDGVVPIGFPVANTEIHVLDHRSRPVPVGVPGELCIGGVQVTAGYLHRPELNRAAFVDGPRRLYRSGDLVRRLPDGALEYLGRLDHQVKIRGLRIEPGEIEHALREHPQVEAAAVVAYAADGGDTRLAGYVVPADPGPAAGDLRAHLAARLPAHLVPAVFVPLDALPLSANGKLDRAALPAPQATTTAPARGGGPLSPAEARIAAVFADVLGSGPVDAEDNFFDLGGDSFQAIRAVREIPGAGVAMLLQHPSPRTLAAALADPARGPGDLLVPLTPRRGAALRTLICVPYGGGHPIVFRALAERLPETTAVRAVRLPGRDAGDQELQPLETVARGVVREILDGVDGPLALYGHCIGVALTTRIAQLLQEAGRPVDRVFLGGSFPFPTRKVLGFELIRLVPFRRRESDEQLLRYLQSLGGFEDVVDAGELTRVMAAFRHDGQGAGRWFTAQYDEDTVRLDAPITFVAGDADPETRHFRRRFREWERFSRSVDLAVVPGGGHYFVKHHAAELAAIVEHAW